VRDYLVAEFGFEESRFKTEGLGEEQPVASNDTAAGRRANRRVEIYVRP
jgi:outer membrane protein OmpA-like peptidoglycan-associated protein